MDSVPKHLDLQILNTGRGLAASQDGKGDDQFREFDEEIYDWVAEPFLDVMTFVKDVYPTLNETAQEKDRLLSKNTRTLYLAILPILAKTGPSSFEGSWQGYMTVSGLAFSIVRERQRLMNLR